MLVVSAAVALAPSSRWWRSLDRREEARYASIDGGDAVSELGRVVDREGLDDEKGPRARVRIGVPAAWAAARATVIVEAPHRVACARCDGGGCDGCARSGVVRLSDDAAERTFAVPLPASLGDGAIVRLSRPFGADGPVAQVLCEIRATAEAEGCRREGDVPGALVFVPPPGALARRSSDAPWRGPLVGVVAVVLAVLSWLLTHLR